MANKMDVDQVADHVGGSFEWETKPECCDLLVDAIEEEKFIFVGNMGSKESNNFYMLPVTNEGYFARDNGIHINNCPWCGAKIKGRKKYAK